jgi:hypothetical protein
MLDLAGLRGCTLPTQVFAYWGAQDSWSLECSSSADAAAGVLKQILVHHETEDFLDSKDKKLV